MMDNEVEVISGFEIQTCPRCGCLPTAHKSESDCIRTLRLKVEMLEQRANLRKRDAEKPNGR
jgi:hypothetical protein